MTILAYKIEVPFAENITVTKDTLRVDLSDGRTISVPLAWFPRLLHSTPEERNNWRLIGKGHGIHWEEIDEDISIEGLLAGRPSGESQNSFKKWLAMRSSGAAKRSKLPGSLDEQVLYYLVGCFALSSSLCRIAFIKFIRRSLSLLNASIACQR
jgi:hypothetical protein